MFFRKTKRETERLKEAVEALSSRLAETETQLAAAKERLAETETRLSAMEGNWPTVEAMSKALEEATLPQPRQEDFAPRHPFNFGGR